LDQPVYRVDLKFRKLPFPLKQEDTNQVALRSLAGEVTDQLVATIFSERRAFRDLKPD
jgi:hypothetical protein